MEFTLEKRIPATKSIKTKNRERKTKKSNREDKEFIEMEK